MKSVPLLVVILVAWNSLWAQPNSTRAGNTPTRIDKPAPYAKVILALPQTQFEIKDVLCSLDDEDLKYQTLLYRFLERQLKIYQLTCLAQDGAALDMPNGSWQQALFYESEVATPQARDICLIPFPLRRLLENYPALRSVSLALGRQTVTDSLASRRQRLLRDFAELKHEVDSIFLYSSYTVAIGDYTPVDEIPVSPELDKRLTTFMQNYDEYERYFYRVHAQSESLARELLQAINRAVGCGRLLVVAPDLYTPAVLQKAYAAGGYQFTLEIEHFSPNSDSKKKTR